MSKPCTICKVSEDIQNRIAALRAGENKHSYKDIENIIGAEFGINVDASSLGRHFKNHVKRGRGREIDYGKGVGNGKGGGVNYAADREKDTGADLEKSEIGLVDIEDAPPTNTEVHKELCNVLSNSIRIFNRRMNETASSVLPYDMHIDAIKALDILVNTFEKLYQNPREGIKQQELPTLGDLQIKIAHEILKEPIEDDSLKTKVQNIFEEHQKQKDHAQEYLKE